MDKQDEKLAAQAVGSRRKLDCKIPINGDVLRYPDGYLRRVAHAYDDCCQPASWGGQGSNYITPKSGRSSYSGALNCSLKHDLLTLADDLLPQKFWFFSHGVSGAGRGVDCMIPVRVWDVSIEDDGTRKAPCL